MPSGMDGHSLAGCHGAGELCDGGLGPDDWQPGPRYVKFVGLKAGANSLSSLLNFIQVLWGHRLGP